MIVPLFSEDVPLHPIGGGALDSARHLTIVLDKDGRPKPLLERIKDHKLYCGFVELQEGDIIIEFYSSKTTTTYMYKKVKKLYKADGMWLADIIFKQYKTREPPKNIKFLVPKEAWEATRIYMNTNPCYFARCDEND